MSKIKEIEAVLAPMLEAESAELVDLTFAKEGPKWVLRVYLDKEGGITLDECGYLSDRIGSLLDSTRLMERSYVLEVSSPGLDRVVKKEKDFVRFAGRTIRVRLRLPEDGQRNFKGKLLGVQDGKAQVVCDGTLRQFSLDSIDEARLDYAADAAEL